MRRRWRLILALLAGVLVVGATTGWLMFQHIPGWYRPRSVAPADFQRVRDDLETTQDLLSEWLIKADGPFELRFGQDQINDWLTVRAEVWPRSLEWLPPSLTDPFVHLDTGSIRVAATHHDDDGLATVVSVQMAAGADDNGINLQLLEVAAGALAVPESWIQRELAALDASDWPVGGRAKHQLDDRPLPALAGLFDGIVLPNAWIWWNAEKPFRIIRIHCEPGALFVTFEPLGDQTARR